MCGLFGVTAPRAYPTSQRRVLGRRVRMLGLAAQERGIDAAGVAIQTSAASGRPARESVGGAAHVEIGGWTILRTSGAFARLPTRTIDQHARRATTVLGHTRWATQGHRTRRNASPMLVGSVLGTHNGDLDVASLRPYTTLAGRDLTDSAVLFGALSDGHALGDLREDVVPVLSNAVGRVAAVWADLTQPDRLWLARGALSPLCYATDEHGAAWWASNPDWLRQLEAEHDVRLDRISMLDEGTIHGWRIDEETVRIVEYDVFPVHARRSDVRIANTAAWRGFTTHDRAADRRRLRHRVIDMSQNPLTEHLVPNEKGRTIEVVDGALI